MLNVKKILFPTDFSDCAESAFSHAAYLADKYGAELYILHVEENDNVSLADRLNDVRITPEEIAEQLNVPVSNIGSVEAQEPVRIIEVEERAERAAPVILHFAESHDIDLIVMGTHGRRGVRRFMLGSVAEEVLRLSLCPVFTVRHREDRSVWTMKKILAPTDLSENARQATRHAAALAKAYGAELSLLYVVDAATIPTTTAVPLLGAFDVSPESVLARSNEMLLREVQALNAEFNQTSDIGSFVQIGHPAREILEFVEDHGADLLVMGTHGRSGIRRLLMGSVAEQVIRNAPCPVFAVKSFGHSLLEAIPKVDELEAVSA